MSRFGWLSCDKKRSRRRDRLCRVEMLASFPPQCRAVPEQLRGMAAELARVFEPHPDIAAAYIFGSDRLLAIEIGSDANEP